MKKTLKITLGVFIAILLFSTAFASEKTPIKANAYQSDFIVYKFVYTITPISGTLYNVKLFFTWVNETKKQYKAGIATQNYSINILSGVLSGLNVTFFSGNNSQDYGNYNFTTPPSGPASIYVTPATQGGISISTTAVQPSYFVGYTIIP